MGLKSFLGIVMVTLLVFPQTGQAQGIPPYLEANTETNIEPGRETETEYGKLYALTTLPIQVALHPEVTAQLEVLRQRAAEAIELAKAEDPEAKFSGAVITVDTLTRQIPKDGAQKYWFFVAGYRKTPKDAKTPGDFTPVAHFLAGAYIRHEGKNVFPLYSSPHDNLPFLKASPIREGGVNAPRGDGPKDDEAAE